MSTVPKISSMTPKTVAKKTDFLVKPISREGKKEFFLTNVIP